MEPTPAARSKTTVVKAPAQLRPCSPQEPIKHSFASTSPAGSSSCRALPSSNNPKSAWSHPSLLQQSAQAAIFEFAVSKDYSPRGLDRELRRGSSKSFSNSPRPAAVSSKSFSSSSYAAWRVDQAGTTPANTTPGEDVQETASDLAPAHNLQHAEALALPAKTPTQHAQLKGPAFNGQQQQAGLQDTTDDTVLQHAETSAQPAQPAQEKGPAHAVQQQEAGLQGTTGSSAHTVQHAEMSAQPAQAPAQPALLNSPACPVQQHDEGLQDTADSPATGLQPGQAPARPALLSSPAQAVQQQEGLQDAAESPARALQPAQAPAQAALLHTGSPARAVQQQEEGLQEAADSPGHAMQPAQTPAQSVLLSSPVRAVQLQAQSVQDSPALCAATPPHIQGPIAAAGQQAQAVAQHLTESAVDDERSGRLQAAAVAASAQSAQGSHIPMQPVAASCSADDTVLQHRWASIRPSAHAAPAAPGSRSPMQLAKPSTNTKGHFLQVSSTYAEPAHLGAPFASLLQLQTQPASSCAEPSAELCAQGPTAALTEKAQRTMQDQKPPMLCIAAEQPGHLPRASLRTAQQQKEHAGQITKTSADEPTILLQTPSSDLSHEPALTQQNDSSSSSGMVSSAATDDDDDDLLNAYYDAQTEHNAWRYMRLVTAGRAGLFVAQLVDCHDSSVPSCDQGLNFSNPTSSVHADQQHSQAVGIHAQWQDEQLQRQPQLDAQQHFQTKRQKLLALRCTPYPHPVPTAQSAFYAELDVEMYPEAADAVTVKGTPYQRAWVAVKAAVRDKNAADAAAAAGVGGSDDEAAGAGLPDTLGRGQQRQQQQQTREDTATLAAAAAAEGAPRTYSGSSCRAAGNSSSGRQRLSLQEHHALQWQALQEQHDRYTAQQQQREQQEEGEDDMPQQWSSEPLTPEQRLGGAVLALQRQQRLLLDHLEQAKSMNSNTDSWAGWAELGRHCWQWLLLLFGSSAEANPGLT